MGRNWSENNLKPSIQVGVEQIRAYARYFSVSAICAANDLSSFGFEPDPTWLLVEKEKEKAKAHQREEQKRKKREERRLEGFGIHWDDHFAFIAGNTSDGAAFGITWEEAVAMDEPIHSFLDPESEFYDEAFIKNLKFQCRRR